MVIQFECKCNTFIRIILSFGISGTKDSSSRTECRHQSSLKDKKMIMLDQSARVVSVNGSLNDNVYGIKAWYLRNTYCLLFHGFMYCCPVMLSHTI